MKTLFVFLMGLFLSLSASSQIAKPVKWTYTAKKTSATEATLFIKAAIDTGWHVYAQNIPEGGPVKVSINFIPHNTFQLNGKINEPKSVNAFDHFFDKHVSYFENEVVFIQKIQLNVKKAQVKGTIEYMACSSLQCRPPQTIEFSITVK